jgi:hypothetical protein
MVRFGFGATSTPQVLAFGSIGVRPVLWRHPGKKEVCVLFGPDFQRRVLY